MNHCERTTEEDKTLNLKLLFMHIEKKYIVSLLQNVKISIQIFQCFESVVRLTLLCQNHG